ncbi:hypothetical protein J1N35_029764 [Gossypium stocksii]|uniref:Plastocyanin-like domain-containing protein n=1 Tax=Gossypium stocksii TaxID=47602 RepID=A0A9D3ZTH8_9ROSI|nr:hypothetical protein J1N35_029764 [Gossypium stocksii]
MGSQKYVVLLLSVLLILNSLLFSGADEDHYYEFILQETEITKLCSTKTILTVNGSFPGPEIRVRRGDTVYVNVHNQGRSAVSFDWQAVEDPVDGTNELIQPGKNFTYEIELDDEIGTLWWHARSAWAKATVHGAFVILPAADEEYPFPTPTSDQIIIFGNMVFNSSIYGCNFMVATFCLLYIFKAFESAIAWQIILSGEWFRQELTEANETIAAGQADGYTINGHLGETYGCSNDTTFLLEVAYEGLYLLRLINAVANETMVFAIAQHSFTTVGQNATYAQRSFSTSLTLAPGQTIDVLLGANQNVGQYYITAQPSSGRHNTTGVLQYLASTGV